MASDMPLSIDDTLSRLAACDYVADERLATAVFLSLRLQRPLFLEGEPGTGKTEIARTLALMLNRPLIRLQCHEGLDLAGAAYEWNYTRQMLEIRLAEAASPLVTERPAAAGQTGAAGDSSASSATDRHTFAAVPSGLSERLFDERFLIKRALLQAIDPTQPVPPVLLIDELDRADEPFEAFLLEVLSEWQITIPEFGTVKAAQPPVVVLTSNRTREIHDAVKRRCLYHWVGFPDAAREARILAQRVPEAPTRLSRQIVAFVQALRREELYKRPGVAETLEWTRALRALDATSIDVTTASHTLGLLLKYQDDLARIDGPVLQRLVDLTEAVEPARPSGPPTVPAPTTSVPDAALAHPAAARTTAA